MSEWFFQLKTEEEKNKTKVNWSQGKNWATNMFYARWSALYPPPPPLAQFVRRKVAYVQGKGRGGGGCLVYARYDRFIRWLRKALSLSSLILFNLFVR